jgi:hypothetical protein
VEGLITGGAEAGGPLAQPVRPAIAAMTAMPGAMLNLQCAGRKKPLTSGESSREWPKIANTSNVSPRCGSSGDALNVLNKQYQYRGIQIMGRGILLWLLGVPLPIILLLAMCSHN